MTKAFPPTMTMGITRPRGGMTGPSTLRWSRLRFRPSSTAGSSMPYPSISHRRACGRIGRRDDAAAAMDFLDRPQGDSFRSVKLLVERGA
jgi:hypothetical protein